MTTLAPSPTLKGRLSGVATDVQLLLSQTLAVARLEVSEDASKLALAAMGVLAGVFVAAMGAVVLISAMVLGLIALGVPAWAAAALVGVALLAAGAIGTRYFISTLRNAEIGLIHTRESLRETFEWLKRQAGA
jgi:hypothetical protein